MNHIAQILNNPVAATLGWTLLQFLWQGAAIAGLLALGLRIVPSQRAKQRHQLACVALILLLAAPVLTLCFATALATRPVPTTAITVGATSPLPSVQSPAEADPTPLGPAPSQRWLAGLTLVWCAGVVALGLRFLGGWWQAHRWTVQHVKPMSQEWQTRLTQLQGLLGMNRRVGLLESMKVPGPLLVGWLRPVILLPVGLVTGLTPAQVDAILLHELIHIRGHDYLMSLLQRAAETLLFYHPAVWWVSEQVRREREHRCDDGVAEILGGGQVLAGALLTLAEREAPMLSPALAADGGSLTDRIRRLLGASASASPTSRNPRTWIRIFAVVALLSLGVWLVPALTSPRLFTATARIRIEPPKTAKQFNGTTLTYDPYWAMAEISRVQSVRFLEELVNSEPIASRLGKTNLASAAKILRHRILVQPYRNTEVIEITVANEDPELAALIANKIADHLVEGPREQAAYRMDMEQGAREMRLSELDRRIGQTAESLEKLNQPGGGLDAGLLLKRYRDEMEVLQELRKQAFRDALSAQLKPVELPPSNVELIDRAEPRLRPVRWTAR